MLGGPCVRPPARPYGVTLLTDLQELQKYLSMKSKNVGIDVTLHAELDFDILFHRDDPRFGHLKIMLFSIGFL